MGHLLRSEPYRQRVSWLRPNSPFVSVSQQANDGVPPNQSMNIAAQYLEGGSDAGRVSPSEARARLRAAFERMPLAMVLLGWDLDPRVVEACAEECALHKSDLYLWQPLLTGHGPCRPDPVWHVVALNDHPVAGLGDKLEFTFVCPNRPGANLIVACPPGCAKVQ